jgi:hypothetical protein
LASQLCSPPLCCGMVSPRTYAWVCELGSLQPRGITWYLPRRLPLGLFVRRVTATTAGHSPRRDRGAGIRCAVIFPAADSGGPLGFRRRDHAWYSPDYPSWPEGPALPGLGMNGPVQAPPQDVRLPVSSCSRPGASWRGVRLLEAPGYKPWGDVTCLRSESEWLLVAGVLSSVHSSTSRAAMAYFAL